MVAAAGDQEDDGLPAVTTWELENLPSLMLGFLLLVQISFVVSEIMT